MIIGHGEEGFIYFADGKGRPRRKHIDHYIKHRIERPGKSDVLVIDIYAGDCQYQMVRIWHDPLIPKYEYEDYFFKISMSYDSDGVGFKRIPIDNVYANLY